MNHETLYIRLISALENYFNQNTLNKMITELSAKSRYDNKKTMFIKKVLQYAVPKTIREVIIDDLFYEFIPISESDFHNYLYLDKRQIMIMLKDGMSFGAHTVNHPHLKQLDTIQQKLEIENSIFDLEMLGINRDFFCYPHGSYNNSTIEILKNLKVKFSFTTKPIECDSLENNHEIPRFDCNDISKEQEVVE